MILLYYFALGYERPSTKKRLLRVGKAEVVSSILTGSTIPPRYQRRTAPSGDAKVDAKCVSDSTLLTIVEFEGLFVPIGVQR